MPRVPDSMKHWSQDQMNEWLEASLDKYVALQMDGQDVLAAPEMEPFRTLAKDLYSRKARQKPESAAYIRQWAAEHIDTIESFLEKHAGPVWRADNVLNSMNGVKAFKTVLAENPSDEDLTSAMGVLYGTYYRMEEGNFDYFSRPDICGEAMRAFDPIFTDIRSDEGPGTIIKYAYAAAPRTMKDAVLKVLHRGPDQPLNRFIASHLHEVISYSGEALSTAELEDLVFTVVPRIDDEHERHMFSAIVLRELGKRDLSQETGVVLTRAGLEEIGRFTHRNKGAPAQTELTMLAHYTRKMARMSSAPEPRP